MSKTSGNLPWTIEPLCADHILDSFDCGHEALNLFLKRFALVNQKAETARTYVACQGQQVMGYYSLAVGSVQPEQAPERIRKGTARHPVPVLLLARLAVDQRLQCQGLGIGLLKDALRRAANAADIAGIRAVLVHAKDNSAQSFYRHLNFDPSPTDPYHLFLLLKDIRRLLGE